MNDATLNSCHEIPFAEITTGARIFWSGCLNNTATVTQGYTPLAEPLLLFPKAKGYIIISFEGADGIHTCSLSWTDDCPTNVYDEPDTEPAHTLATFHIIDPDQGDYEVKVTNEPALPTTTNERTFLVRGRYGVVITEQSEAAAAMAHALDFTGWTSGGWIDVPPAATRRGSEQWLRGG